MLFLAKAGFCLFIKGEKMGQYFENNSNLESKKRLLKLYINDNSLSFYSDSGVFSNDKIDYGSYTFLKTLLNEDKVNSILDVGCGYGTLGITLLYFKWCKVASLVDVNLRALELTKENIKLNNVSNASCFESDGFLMVNDKYDAIIINPPIRAGKRVIYKMYEDSKSHLNDNGKLYIVIHKDLGANSSISKLKEIYNKVEIINKDKGYFIIRSC